MLVYEKIYLLLLKHFGPHIAEAIELIDLTNDDDVVVLEIEDDLEEDVEDDVEEEDEFECDYEYDVEDDIESSIEDVIRTNRDFFAQFLWDKQ